MNGEELRQSKQGKFDRVAGLKNQQIMNIALITYEFHGEYLNGGLGTYMGQIATLLKFRGHQLDVFCKGEKHLSTYEKAGITIHPIRCKGADAFREKVVSAFQKQTEQKEYDIIEAPECYSSSLLIRQQFPEIPHIIKLHCPAFWMRKINYTPSLSDKIKFRLRRILNGSRQKKPSYEYQRENDYEFHLAKLCPYIMYPSNAVKEVVTEHWELTQTKFVNVPNPYIPTTDYLNIPIKNIENNKPAITYVGRLEKGKGLIELGKAMTYIFQEFPNATLTFVGRIKRSPKPWQNMQQYLEKELWEYRRQLRFLGHVELEQIPIALSQTDISVIPSRWENFPTVCLEAMSAGRAIVGSKQGGMNELLADDCGLRVDTSSPESIAEGIKKLILNPNLRNTLGENARAKVLSKYNGERIGRMMEETYSLAIENWVKVSDV